MAKHKKQIIYPKKSALLAEECGIHFGDGYMKIKKDKWGIHYQYGYYAHALDDKEYIDYVKILMRNLYGLKYSSQKIDNNIFKMLYYSKELVHFKLSIGIPLSPKINLMVPNWIKDNNKYVVTFLRGIFDTDGSLTFKSKWGRPHTYPYVYLSSKIEKFIDEISSLLKRLGFTFSIFRSDNPASNGTMCTTWDIGISGVDNLKKFIREIGFNNRKHITKYLIWKNFGFCPPHTNLQQRENILINKLDPYLLEKCLRADLNSTSKFE